MVLIITVATSLIWIKILKSFDDARGLKSRRTAVSGFFLYGLLSTPLVLLLYELIGPILYSITRVSAVLEDLFLVGPVEELGKFLVFYLVAVGSGSIQEPRDGVLHAASVGLAFAVVENVYYSVYGLNILLYRSLMATAGHMSYAAIWGYAAGVYLYTRRGGRQKASDYGPWLVVNAVAASAVLHGLYNSFLELNLGGAALLLDAVTFFIALAIISHLKKVSPFAEFPFSQYRLAIPQLREALHHNPHNFVLNKRLGLHYIRSRDIEKGRRHLNQASKTKPQELSTRFYLALLDYLSAGRGDRAPRQRARAAVPVLWSQSRAIGGATLRLENKTSDDFADDPGDEARQALYQLALEIPLKSMKQLRRQVRQVFAVHPRRRELFELCDDLVARTRGKPARGRESGGPSRRQAIYRMNRGRAYPLGKGSIPDMASHRRPAGMRESAEGAAKIHVSEPPLAAVDPILAAKKSRALGRIIEQKRREID